MCKPTVATMIVFYDENILVFRFTFYDKEAVEVDEIVWLSTKLACAIVERHSLRSISLSAIEAVLLVANFLELSGVAEFGVESLSSACAAAMSRAEGYSKLRKLKKVTLSSVDGSVLI
eukprot:IDg10353t1